MFSYAQFCIYIIIVPHALNSKTPSLKCLKNGLGSPTWIISDTLDTALFLSLYMSVPSHLTRTLEGPHTFYYG